MLRNYDLHCTNLNYQNEKTDTYEKNDCSFRGVFTLHVIYGSITVFWGNLLGTSDSLRGRGK